MDFGKKECQVAIITDAAELIEKRIRTERERLRRYFAGRSRGDALALAEACKLGA